MFNRRSLRVVILALTIMLLLSACSGAKSGGKAGETKGTSTPETINLRLGHVNAESAVVHLQSVEFAKRVEQKSNGRLKIQIFPNGQLGNESQLLQQVNAGSLDLAATTAMGLGNYVPEVTVLDAAFVFRDVDHQLAYATSEEGQKLLGLVRDKTNMLVVSNPSYGVRHLTTSNKEVRTPEDLKGLKIRSMDFKQAVENVNSLGATATPIPFTELYTALQQKVVDGQENPLNTILASKFYEVQKYLILTGHVVTNGPIVMSKKTWDSLPEDLQKVIMDAGRETMEWSAQLLKEKNNEWLNQLKEKGMVVIEPDREAFRKRALGYLPPLFTKEWGEGRYEAIANFK